MNNAEEIEALYKSSFRGPFPYADCFYVAEQSKVDSSDLIPELDWYFGEIAGYASSATRLGERSAEQRMKAQGKMSVTLFERFPELAVCAAFINVDRTPDLHLHLKVAEELRVGVLAVLRELNLR